ncbi:unnamed protein product [Adineta ricciae]|nr:unnamed protein product [Adineta ricciae]
MNSYWMMLLFIIICVENVQAKKPIRTYLLMRDDRMDKNGFSRFSVLDSSGKEHLYRLKSSYTHDRLELISYPSKEVTACVEGQWKAEILNVSFQIFDSIRNETTNGTIQKVFNLFVETYTIEWNYESFLLKKKLFTSYHKFYDWNGNLLGQFRKRFRWFSWSSFVYDLKIFIDKLAHEVYFFSVAIADHRNLMA